MPIVSGEFGSLEKDGGALAMQALVRSHVYSEAHEVPQPSQVLSAAEAQALELEQKEPYTLP
jgi:hypothetical protein